MTVGKMCTPARESRHEVHFHSATITIMAHPLPRVEEVMDVDCGRPGFRGSL